jgi:hypothetical protein
MLALQTQQKYIRKAVQLPNGSWALVVFELVEINGKIIAKAISGKIVGEKCFDEEVILALPAYFERENIEPVVSPFFSEVQKILKDLSFVVSQPARAPTF